MAGKQTTLKIKNKMKFRELKQNEVFNVFKIEYGLTSWGIRRSKIIRDMIETEIKFRKKKEVNNG